MGSILMVIFLLANEGETMIVRQYGKKRCDAGIFFNAVICLFASIFFILNDKNILTFPKELFPYAIINCIFYAGGFYFMYAALAEGSFIGSKMLSSSSVIIPVLYGILFLSEPAKTTTYIAIILMFVSLFMQIYQKSEEGKKPSSHKWIIFAFLSAVCNGFLMVVNRAQQIRFNSVYDNKFMFFSFFGAFLFLLIYSLLKETEKIRTGLSGCLIYGMGAGLLNGIKNFINLLMLLYFPISVATPVRTVLGYILSFLLSVLLYKEQFTKLKIAGIIIGILSVVLFTI